MRFPNKDSTSINSNRRDFSEFLDMDSLGNPDVYVPLPGDEKEIKEKKNFEQKTSSPPQRNPLSSKGKDSVIIDLTERLSILTAYQKKLSENPERNNQNEIERVKKLIAQLEEQRAAASSGSELKQSASHLTYEEVKVPGDGHCLYSAVGLYVGQDHKQLREQVAQELESNYQNYQDFFELKNSQTPKDYIAGVQNGSEWAGNAEIVALMHILQRPIIVVRPGENAQQRVENPTESESKYYSKGLPIPVSYNGSTHYNALILVAQDHPRSEAQSSSRFTQGDLNLFNQAVKVMKDTITGQGKKYGAPEQVKILNGFFQNELEEVHSLIDTDQKEAAFQFLTKYSNELSLHFEPSPAHFVDFLTRQETEAKQYHDNSLVELVQRERAALDQGIEDLEAKKREKENTFGARLRRWTLPIASTVVAGASGWPLYFLSKALGFAGTKVAIDGDYSVVFANFANKDEEQDVFMHKTLPYSGILLCGGMISGVLVLFTVFHHRYVVKPMKKELQDLHQYWDKDRQIMAAMADVIVNIPIASEQSILFQVAQSNNNSTVSRSISESKAGTNLANLSLEAARRGALRVPSSLNSQSFTNNLSSSSSSSSLSSYSSSTGSRKISS